MKLQWPASCKHPKTLSFRAAGDDNVFKNFNSVFFDPYHGETQAQFADEASWFTNTSTSGSAASLSTESEDHESLEMIVREARSERLFFEPGGETSSILGESKSLTENKEEEEEEETEFVIPSKEGKSKAVLAALDSENPYDDFRRSMEEMVEANGGFKDWDSLEELLGLYLRVNGKNNHGFIIDAFVDVLISLAASSSSSSPTNHPRRRHQNNDHSTSYSSAASSFNCSSSSSSLLSPNYEGDEQETFVLS